MGSGRRIELSVSCVCQCAALSVDFIPRQLHTTLLFSIPHHFPASLSPPVTSQSSAFARQKKKQKKKRADQRNLRSTTLPPRCGATMFCFCFFFAATVLSVLSFKCVKFLTLPRKLQMIQGRLSVSSTYIWPGWS